MFLFETIQSLIWVNRYSKMQKRPTDVSVFLSHHYGLTNYFEVINFAFPNIIARGVSTCSILLFSQDQHFKKLKAQKIVKFSFQSFQLSFSQNLQSFAVVLSSQNNLCIILSSSEEQHLKKIKFEFTSLVSFQTSKILMFFRKIFHVASFEIIFGRNNCLKFHVFGFYNSHFICSGRTNSVQSLDQLNFGLIDIQKCENVFY